MMNVAACLVGIILVVGFVGIILLWLGSVPLTIIGLLVIAAMLYDVAKTIRANREGADR